MNKDIKMIVEALRAMSEINDSYSESLNGMCDILESLTHKIIRVETTLSELISKFDMLLAVNKVIDLKDESAKDEPEKAKAKKGTTEFFAPGKAKVIGNTLNTLVKSGDKDIDEVIEGCVDAINRDDFKKALHRMPINFSEFIAFAALNRRIITMIAKSKLSDSEKDLKMDELIGDFKSQIVDRVDDILSSDLSVAKKEKNILDITTAYIKKCANEMDEDTNSDTATAKDTHSSLLERSRKSFISIFHREPKNDEELETFDNLNHKIARLLITGDKDDRHKAISMMNKFIDDYILTDGYLLTTEDIDRIENSIDIAGKIANIANDSDEAKAELSNLLGGVADDETTDKIIRDFKNLFGEDVDDKKITVKKITANKKSLPDELIERLVGDEGEKHTLDDGSTIRKVVVDSPEKFRNMMKFVEAASGTEGVDEVLDTLTQLGYFDKDKEDDDDEDAPEVLDTGDVFEINGEVVFNDEADTNKSESETNAEPDTNENDKEE